MIIWPLTVVKPKNEDNYSIAQPLKGIDSNKSPYLNFENSKAFYTASYSKFECITEAAYCDNYCSADRWAHSKLTANEQKEK